MPVMPEYVWLVVMGAIGEFVFRASRRAGAADGCFF